MHRITRRSFALGAASATLAASLPTRTRASWKPGDNYLIRIGGSQPVHAIYSVSAGHKAIIERTLPGVRVELLATQGGVENANLIIAEEVEAANGNAAGAYSVYFGKFEAEGLPPQKDILSWLPGYDAPQSIIVNQDSGISSFSDLLGKSIALGPTGSGAESVATSTITSLGHSDSSFRRVLRTDPKQAFGALAAGNVDAVIWGSAHPVAIIIEQITTRSIKFVSFTKEELQKVSAAIPYITAALVPAGTYDIQDSDMLWPSAGVHHWIHAKIPDDLVYAMTKAIWENRPELEAIHSSQKLLSADTVKAQAGIVPFHPGAARYFIEQKILSTPAG